MLKCKDKLSDGYTGFLYMVFATCESIIILKGLKSKFSRVNLSLST